MTITTVYRDAARDLEVDVNEIVSIYAYGIGCLVGGFYIGMVWKGSR
jgi:hypothetical protein